MLRVRTQHAFLWFGTIKFIIKLYKTVICVCRCGSMISLSGHCGKCVSQQLNIIIYVCPAWLRICVLFFMTHAGGSFSDRHYAYGTTGVTPSSGVCAKPETNACAAVTKDRLDPIVSQTLNIFGKVACGADLFYYICASTCFFIYRCQPSAVPWRLHRDS